MNQLEKAAQDQVMPYCNKESGEGKLEMLKKLLEILDLVFGDQDKAATARRKLLSLKQCDQEFSHYFMEFQQYIPDVRWNEEAQLDAL